MEKLKPHERATLESLFKTKQKSLSNVLYDFLNKKYKEVVRTKDYVFAVGDIPVMLLAHMDTVFNSPPQDIYFDSEKNVMWSPQGLGADDRAGVWAIIKIIRSGLRPSVLFTTDEELGGKGAGRFVKDYPKPFNDKIKYLIQLDRRGTNDCVFYECENLAFTDYVESFGFCENWGSFTDISVICPEWKIAGVNLSIGYQDEHSFSETLHIGPMNQTINKVIKMLNASTTAPQFEYIESAYSKYAWYYDGYHDYKPNEKHVCYHCGQTKQEYDMFPVKKKDGTTGFVCDGCLNHFNWCQRCNEAFEFSPNAVSDILCPDCELEIFGKGKVSVNV